MAKTVEDLQQSRADRDKNLAALNGEVPTSILRYDKGMKAMDLIVEEERSYENKADYGNHDKNSKLGKVFGVSGRTCRGEGGGLSRFPQNVGRALLMIYTEPGQVVVDPFAGHNSRMEMCFRAGRHYRGNDLSAKFQDANRIILAKLMEERQNDMFSAEQLATIVELTTGDSRKLPWENGCGDFTITSPPYYCLEHYGDEPEQLGLGAKSYWHFLERLQDVMRENFRVLKPGRFCVWCVNDFRYEGRFYNYHGDCIRLMEKVGFVQHDIAIVDLVSSIAAAFVNQIFERKILPKRHEYALIFQKPR